MVKKKSRRNVKKQKEVTSNPAQDTIVHQTNGKTASTVKSVKRSSCPHVAQCESLDSNKFKSAKKVIVDVYFLCILNH